MHQYPPDTGNREFLDVLMRLANLAEYREGNNQTHLDRIRRYCRVIALSLDLSPLEVDAISIASQLHDIGKVAIPDKIVRKSENLNPDEWEIIKSHTTIGASLLRGSPSVLIQTGELVALSHHERWDGSGYPKGLEKDDIPISGRICAVADVFDALTSNRPYKDKIPLEEARSLIKDGGGDLFDPQIVKAFDENFDEIFKIRRTAK